MFLPGPFDAAAPALENLQPQPVWNLLHKPIQVGRYHGWFVHTASLKSNIQVLASDETGNPMAIEHRNLKVMGFQFHPESILTPEGDRLLNNWWEGLAGNS